MYGGSPGTGPYLTGREGGRSSGPGGLQVGGVPSELGVVESGGSSGRTDMSLPTPESCKTASEMA